MSDQGLSLSLMVIKENTTLSCIRTEKMTEKGIKFAKVKLETISWVGEGNENSEFVKREGWQNSWARKEDILEKSAGA